MNETALRVFLNLIPSIVLDNTTDVANPAFVRLVIAHIRKLVQLDLKGLFNAGHGIHFRHRAWTALLNETEKGLRFMARALQYQLSLRNTEKGKLTAALTRVKQCIHRIKQLKQEGQAMRSDLQRLKKRIATMTGKALTDRLRIDLVDVDKNPDQRHVEIKKMRGSVQKSRERLESAMKTLNSIMEQIVGRVVYQSNVLSQLDPSTDQFIKNALDILRDQVTEDENRIRGLRKYADNNLNQASRLRVGPKISRAKQVSYFTDEVIQRQRNVDTYTKLLNEARNRLQSGGATPI